MTIFLNDMPVILPSDYMTVSDLLKNKNISQQGTAIAINNKIVRKIAWETTHLNDLDRVTIISAAFGG